MKIYTRRGDAGETDLFGGPRVAKDHPRVAAYGALDELNAAIGVAAATSASADVHRLAQRVQGTLFELGAWLATPDSERRRKSGLAEPEDADVEELEAHIDALEGELTPLRRFVLPGGTAAAAGFHLARTICRRAERDAVALAREDEVAPALLRYLNRLSDLLFVIARVENRRAEVGDVEWAGRPADS